MEGSDDRLKTLNKDPVFLKFAAVLPSTGAIVDDIREITESEVCKYFGPKASKSGWKYAKHTTPEQAAEIYNLWTRVYDDKCVPNKEITLQFARGLILQQTQPVNWAEFAVRRQRYREAVRVSKNLSGKGLESREVAKVGSGGVTVLGKKRFQVQSRKEFGIPACVKLTMREVDEENTMGKRVALSKVKGSRGKGDELGPSWVEGELEDMQIVIDTTETMLEECRKEMLESSAEVEGLEGQARRAAIMLSDRIVMLEDHEQELTKICDQETFLQNKIAEKEALLRKSGGSVELSLSLSDDKLRCDEVCLSKALASRSAAHCSSVVVGCRADVASVDCRLQESAQRRKNVLSRVTGLESLLVGMHNQLRKMNEGSGYGFFPRPLANNPQNPMSSIHCLNACPVCGFWYKSCNFIPLCCGHTYHPFCLSLHARSSSACCFQDCRQEFSEESIASIGIRPEKRSSIDSCTVKIEGGSLKDTRQDTLRLQNLVAGKLQSQPLAPSLAIDACPARVPGSATPSTSTSADQNSERIEGSSYRSGENMNVDSGHLSRSEPNLALHNIFRESQSSVTNEIWEESAAVNCKGEPVCNVCKNKPPTVKLTACGHGGFCFKCISGIERCPLCNSGISGWVPIPSKSNGRPSLFGRGDATEKETDLQDSDDDEDGNGLVHWCDTDVFSQGGIRTVSPDLELEKTLEQPDNVPEEEPSGGNDVAEEIQELPVETPQAEVAEVAEQRLQESEPSQILTRRQRILTLETPTASEEGALGQKPKTVYTKKRGRPCMDVETLNHTRKTERPLNEILITAPMFVSSNSKGGKNSSKEQTSYGKKLRGNQVRLTVPAKFRD